MSEHSSAPQKYRFENGERVLCFHGPLLYEAKVVKANVKDKQVKYYVHYQGWNKTWDEWVPEARLAKWNDENLKKQKELKEEHDKKAPKSASKKQKKLPGTPSTGESSPLPPSGKEGFLGSTPSGLPADKSASKKAGASLGPGSISGGGGDTGSVKSDSGSVSGAAGGDKKKGRSRVEAHIESEEQYINRPDIKVKMPEELKPLLVDDWDLITRQKKLVQLPAKATVDQILDDYVAHKRSVKGLTPGKESQIQELALGVKEYFNFMLGTMLLYKFERPQYQDILAEKQQQAAEKKQSNNISNSSNTNSNSDSSDKKPDENDNEKEEDPKMSSVYGGIHLLRLFCRLGNVLAQSSIDEKSLQNLVNALNEFLKFFERKASQYISQNDYVTASPEYQRKAV